MPKFSSYDGMELATQVIKKNKIWPSYHYNEKEKKIFVAITISNKSIYILIKKSLYIYIICLWACIDPSIELH